MDDEIRKRLADGIMFIVELIIGLGLMLALLIFPY
jgi:hypothetical protein